MHVVVVRSMDDVESLRCSVRRLANPCVVLSEKELQQCRRMAYALSQHSWAKVKSILSTSEPAVATFQADG